MDVVVVECKERNFTHAVLIGVHLRGLPTFHQDEVAVRFQTVHDSPSGRNLVGFTLFVIPQFIDIKFRSFIINVMIDPKNTHQLPVKGL